MMDAFTYDNQNRLTEVWLDTTQTGSSAYDGYGRMTAKTANGQLVFYDAEFSTTAKPHAMDAATSFSGVFPVDPQTVTYTGFDKVKKIKQGADSLCYTYGYDHQRIFMDEHVGNKHRAKRYVGSCEYITETDGNATDTQWLTYLNGPTGVYAVVVTENGRDKIHYILKDNLGSWTTIADEEGSVEQQLSYDAWGNLRNPSTWSGNFSGIPMFDRGFTGHEHLTAFGLINMNGRMYDQVMSSFLSVDQYVQSPENAQGFNRYAYCLYNPLRYIDPSGWLAGSGDPSYPINTVTIEGQLYIVLPEFTVTSTPILDNEFVYTPYYGGSRGDQWDFDNSRPSQDGGGAGGGNHGGSPKNTTPDPNINIEIASKLLISANVYTSIESSLYFNRLTRTWRDKMDIFRSFDFNGNGSTGGKISYGEMMSVKYQKASSWLNGIGIGLSTIQMASAESIDDKIQYGSDLVFGMIGYAPGGGIISTFWFLGGRELVFQYGETMGLLLEDGINPGYPVYQPFK